MALTKIPLRHKRQMEEIPRPRDLTLEPIPTGFAVRNGALRDSPGLGLKDPIRRSPVESMVCMWPWWPGVVAAAECRMPMPR